MADDAARKKLPPLTQRLSALRGPRSPVYLVTNVLDALRVIQEAVRHWSLAADTPHDLTRRLRTATKQQRRAYQSLNFAP